VDLAVISPEKARKSVAGDHWHEPHRRRGRPSNEEWRRREDAMDHLANDVSLDDLIDLV